MDYLAETLVLFLITVGVHSASSQLEGSVKMGCYKDYADGSLQRVIGKVTIIRNLTLDICREFCKTNDTESFTYFGTQFYYECFCGNKYSTLGSLPESSCNTPCEGNRSQMCGGNKALSVYTVCPRGRYGPKCGRQCGHCKNQTVGCVRRGGSCFIPGECENGWQGEKCNKDIDECSIVSHGCDHNCNNTVGSYVCSCLSGYSLSSRDSKTCEDIDECLVNNGGCSQLCNNTEGSFNCECRNGYVKDKETPSQCNDIDECNVIRHGCQHYCNNTAGSFYCSCQTGYAISARDSKICKDINECLVNNGGCSQLCYNTEGSFNCDCRNGYVKDKETPSHCNDIDECNVISHGCEHYCNNTAGSYFCSCQTGYAISPRDRKTCKDINECLVNNGGCSQLCNNTEGSFNCDCRAGYMKDKDTLSKCNDINECLKNKGGCEHKCHNTEGSYTCKCDEGYLTNPNNSHLCLDIDECAADVRIKNCGVEYQGCTNIAGSYICQCKEGSYPSEDNKYCIASMSMHTLWNIGISCALALIAVVSAISCCFLYRKFASQKTEATELVTINTTDKDRPNSNTDPIKEVNEISLQPQNQEDNMYDCVENIQPTEQCHATSHLQSEDTTQIYDELADVATNKDEYEDLNVKERYVSPRYINANHKLYTSLLPQH